MKEGYYILVDLRDRRCVVVGGGSIATRKVDALCRCGAEVHIVATQFCETLADRSDVTLHHKEYDAADVDKAVLVFSCVDDAATNRQVADDCRKAGVLCNVVDDPSRCDFTVPAVLKRGPIQIAVGTAGASPYLAGRLRDLIGGWLDRAYEPFARKLAALRPSIVEKVPRIETRKTIFQRLAGRESFDRFKREGGNAWCEWISETTNGKLTTDEIAEVTAKPSRPGDRAARRSSPSASSQKKPEQKAQSS